jgi:uncharacterized damage-inducible protein DinB
MTATQPPAAGTAGTANAGNIRQIALGDLEHELAQTRRVLERVPDAHHGWTPHPKSMPLFGLATHIANTPSWAIAMCTSDAFDLADAPGRLQEDPSVAAVLERFDGNVARLKEAMAPLGDEAWLATWTMKNQGQTVMAVPRAAAIRGWLVSHMIHHRAQMTVYLRLLDVPVPGMYGASADEKGR